jgi:hypothetical protein
MNELTVCLQIHLTHHFSRKLVCMKSLKPVMPPVTGR